MNITKYLYGLNFLEKFTFIILISFVVLTLTIRYSSYNGVCEGFFGSQQPCSLLEYLTGYPLYFLSVPNILIGVLFFILLMSLSSSVIKRISTTNKNKKNR